MSVDTPEPFRRRIAEALVIAAIPAYAYIVAFFYQAGMCDAFDLPWDLIDLDISSVVVSAGRLLAGLAMVLLVVQAFYYPITSSLRDRPETANRLREALFLAILWGGIAWLGRASLRSALMGIGAAVLTAVFIFFLPRLLNTEGATFEEKAAHTRKVNSAFPKWIDVFAERHGPTPAWMLFLAVFILYGAWNAGRGEVLRAEQYLTVSIEDRSWVVLREVRSDLVVAAFDQVSRRVSREVRLVHASDLPFLKLERVGPLYLESEGTRSHPSEIRQGE